jgi:hypothetical protein
LVKDMIQSFHSPPILLLGCLRHQRQYLVDGLKDSCRIETGIQSQGRAGG